MTSQPDHEHWLLDRIAFHSGIDRGAITSESEFADLGIESSAVVAIAEELSARLQQHIDPSMVFEARTVGALLAVLVPADRVEPAGADSVHPSASGPDQREPVAVVGMACRVPGADSPEALWALLNAEPVAFGPPPPTPRRLNETLVGAFLSDIDQFDSSFFAIGRREAAQMDPQHRLILELVYEALENAGIDPSALKDSQVGVWIGAGQPEYGVRFHRDPVATGVEARTGVCVASSSVANRVSYTFGFRGPSVMVDTACSSSLVSILTAARSIWSGECDVAIAGGVNLLIEDATWMSLQEAGVLSPSHVCSAFSEKADGYVRGEGAGVVVLKRLAQARQAGDRVYAAILGGAVNHNGRSHGMMAPNPGAQQELLARAYADACVDPGEVCFVETHGTGTVLGDSAEARALGLVLGGSDRTTPCFIGSIKPHIGHLEAAAGVAGMMKACLALARGSLPPSGHADPLNPYIEFDALGLRVARGPVDVVRASDSNGPVIAGVSSFGFGGTNVHVVLRSVSPAMMRRSSGYLDTGSLTIVPISTKSRASLEALKDDYASMLAESPPDVRAVAAAAAFRRAHHAWRIAGVGEDAAAVRESLDQAQPSRAAPPDPSVALVLPGHGARWDLDLTELDRSLPGFGDTVAEADALLEKELGLSVAHAIEERSHQDRGIAVAQAAHVLVQCALGRAWLELGVTPKVVVGHSAGELAAAFLAGAVDLTTAVRIAAERGRVIERHGAPGRLLHVDVDAEAALRWARDVGAEASVAAENSRESTVLVLNVRDAEYLEGLEGPNPRVLDGVDFAAHGPGMAEAARHLAKALSGVRSSTPRIPMVSTATGSPVLGTLDADHWAANLERPVQFATAVEYVVAARVSMFLEIGPRASLRPALLTAATGSEMDVRVVSAGQTSRERLAVSTYRALGRVYEAGVDIRWGTIMHPTRHVDLPRYRWDRAACWVEQPALPRRDDSIGQPLPDTAPAGDPSPTPVPLLAQLAQSPDDAHGDLLLEHVQWLIALELACPVEAVDRDVQIHDLGLESISAGAIKNQLSDELGARINLADILADIPLSGIVTNLLAVIRQDDGYLGLLDEARLIYSMSDEEVDAHFEASREH